MLDFYEENSNINFDYWELKFWKASGYYPNFLRKDDRAEFLAFVREESDDPDHPYPEGA